MGEEMVTQFLSRLPPKALMRFKCIRKSWYNLINSPSFVAQNLSNSMNNKFISSTRIIAKHIIVKDNSITDKKDIVNIIMHGNDEEKQFLLSSLSLCDDPDGDDQELSCVIEDELIIPSRLYQYCLCSRIVGHCDGIICLSGDGDTTVLCNPSIKEFDLVPKSCLLPDEDCSKTNSVGFGYDSKAKVYKVVNILSYCYSHLKAEVYELGTDCWREIEFNVEIDEVLPEPGFDKYFKGVYYWNAFRKPLSEKETHRVWKDTLPYSGLPLEFVIVAFDMSNEVFYLISQPEEDTFAIDRSLIVWKESLHLITYTYEGDAPKWFDIWQNEDPDFLKGSWTKCFAINPIEAVIPLAFWKSNEILMGDADGYIVSYNLDTRSLKCLPIHGAEKPRYIGAVEYVNSIISVNRANKIKYLNTS
ncbi:PREDICTED: F-box protein At1g30790-like [Fragaria vesca subsp. vesca]